jgi:hypothetical protein
MEGFRGTTRFCPYRWIAAYNARLALLVAALSSPRLWHCRTPFSTKLIKLFRTTAVALAAQSERKSNLLKRDSFLSDGCRRIVFMLLNCQRLDQAFTTRNSSNKRRRQNTVNVFLMFLFCFITSTVT